MGRNREQGVLRFDPCPECYSEDNLAIYVDGSWCFTPGCTYNEDKSHQVSNNKMDEPLVKYREPLLAQGFFRGIPKRGINEESCRRYNYHYAKYTGSFKRKNEFIPVNDSDVAVYDVRDAFGKLVAQKIRGPDKLFKWLGDPKDCGLLGKDKWEKGKNKLIITEGIEDMMAVAQATDYHMNVASLPNGAGDAAKVFLHDYKKIMAHDQIILVLDNDSEGQKALEDAKNTFSPHKISVVELEGKDACEILAKIPNGQTELKIAIFKAEPSPPLNLLRGVDVTLEQLLKPARIGFRVPTFPGLDYYLNGFAKKELTIWAGGTKLGKTDAVSRIEYYLATVYKQRIIDIKVEADTDENILQFIALELKIPFKTLVENPVPYANEIAKAREKLMPYFEFYQQSGRCTPKKLMELMYFCYSVYKADFIFIDNLTKVISGAESSRDGERKDIDIFMSDLADFCKNTGVGVHLVVHLKNDSHGRSWWQGKILTDPGQMRGSGNIGNIGENFIYVGGQTKGYKGKPFDRDIRWLGLSATRRGKDSRTITDFYKLNKQTWEVEIVDCPWEDETELEE